MVASAAEAEAGGMFHNGQTSTPLQISLHELGFTQLPTPIKTDNSAAEGIVTATVRQKRSKAIEMRFYWMKDRVKQKDFFVYCNQEAKTWGIISRNITDHITIGKFVLHICIWQIPYLKSIIISCTNGSMLCSRQSIWLKPRQCIRLQLRQTVLFCKGVLMSHVHIYTKIIKQ